MRRPVQKFILGLAALAFASPAAAAPRSATEKPGPQKSGFYDFFAPTGENDAGVGILQKFSCTVSQATQPLVYAGNFLVDCDGEVPHNETTIAVNPLNPNHAVGGYHSYQINFLGATVVQHIVSTASVTFDGGKTWREVLPPIAPFQFTGDPALTFDAKGRLYYASIADHEGPGLSFTAPSIVVATSDDGGLTWTNPVTVARGQGAVNTGGSRIQIFQDKEFIAADRGPTSPFKNRVYVSWTSFQEGPDISVFRAPIQTSRSDDGVTWSSAMEISGFHPACKVALSGRPNECDLNQDSYPTVAPNGRVYVSFENFNTPTENQLMVVRSDDGGRAFGAPVRVETIFDINFPLNVDGRATLTGCQLRYSAVANSAADPSDPTGNTVYVAFADNRNGTETSDKRNGTAQFTNVDVFLARSGDGGKTWAIHQIDGSSNDQFYPWVAVSNDGRVDVGYMDRSYSSGQKVCQYGFTLARATFDRTTGKMTRLTHERVDSGLSDPGRSRWFSATTNGNSRFVGDYNAVAIGSDGSTWSLWTDHRNIIANPPSPTRNHGQHAVGVRTPSR
jgi:hypothetical protein